MLASAPSTFSTKSRFLCPSVHSEIDTGRSSPAAIKGLQYSFSGRSASRCTLLIWTHWDCVRLVRSVNAQVAGWSLLRLRCDTILTRDNEDVPRKFLHPKSVASLTGLQWWGLRSYDAVASLQRHTHLHYSGTNHASLCG